MIWIDFRVTCKFKDNEWIIAGTSLAKVAILFPTLTVRHSLNYLCVLTCSVSLPAHSGLLQYLFASTAFVSWSACVPRYPAGIPKTIVKGKSPDLAASFAPPIWFYCPICAKRVVNYRPSSVERRLWTQDHQFVREG